MGDLEGIDNLRIFRVLDPEVNPLITDFTILGLRKESPSYDKGRKVSSKYICVDNDDLVVEKIFNDIVSSTSTLEALEVTFNWYDESNIIGLSKTEVVKIFNKYEAETEYRKRRFRQIDYLVGGAKGTPIEQYLDSLFEHYYVQVQKYKEKGTSEFYDAVVGETLEPYLSYLNIVVGLNGLTVKDSIINQINQIN